MKKNVVLFFLLLSEMAVFPYVPQEWLFETTFVEGPMHRIACVASNGGPLYSTEVVSGRLQFTQRVLRGDVPVVLHVYSKSEHPVVRFVYRYAAQEFKGKVSFVTIDIDKRENFAIIRDLMVPLGVSTITVPFFLFFDNRSLVLPPVVFPPFTRSLSSDALKNIKNNFINQIRSQFFLGKKAENSTLNKMAVLSKKMNRWLGGFQHISKKDLKAYHLSRRGGW